MKRILVISWFFPPINSSEGLVTYKLLNNSKLKYDVYTQKNNNLWSYINTEELKINKNINPIYSNSITLEEYVGNALKYFDENHDLYDIIMTRSMPVESHIIGLKIKEKYPNIIWISSFGDPIANNPYTLISIDTKNPYALSERYNRHMSIKEMISPKRMLKEYIYKRRINVTKKNLIYKNIDIQKEVINKSNYSIYNSTYQEKYMLKDYKNKEELSKKSIILPHSFDSTLYPKKTIKNDKLVFSYIGHLDDIRSPRLLLEGVKILKAKDENLSKKVVFNFYGNMSDSDKLYIIDNELLDVINIKKGVDYLKSLEIMTSSDYLLHIDANISEITNENIFFAAKLADYLGSKKPIIGITMLDGISADILRENNSLVLTFSKNDILNYLYLIIYENYKFKMNDKTRKNYDALQVAKKFDSFISEVKNESK